MNWGNVKWKRAIGMKMRKQNDWKSNKGKTTKCPGRMNRIMVMMTIVKKTMTSLNIRIMLRTGTMIKIRSILVNNSNKRNARKKWIALAKNSNRRHLLISHE